MRDVDDLRPSRWLFGLARAERLLDHRLPGDDPVARLLSDANRGAAGPVRGEEQVALAFRTAAPPVRRSVEAGPLWTLAPGLAPRRAAAAPRLLALKVAAIGVATVAVGGLALARTVDGLAMPPQTQGRPTLSIATEQDAVAARGGIIPTAVTTLAGGDGTRNTVRPGAGTPAGAASTTPAAKPTADGPAAKGPASTGPGRDAESGAKARDCQTWARGPGGPKGRREAWAKAVKRLRGAAGGLARVPGYCYPVLHGGAQPNPGVPKLPPVPRDPAKVARSVEDLASRMPTRFR